MRCSIYGCTVDNSTKGFNPGTRFFTFPKDKNLQKQWLHLCKRADNFNVANARICSNHFVEDDYERNLMDELLGHTSKHRRALKKKAVPTENLPMSKIRKDSSRKQRIEKRERTKLIENILKELNGIDFNIIGKERVKHHTELLIQTNHDDRDQLIDQLKLRIAEMEREKESDTEALNKIFTKTQIKKLKIEVNAQNGLLKIFQNQL
ncbi:hypothetical protein ABEB36_014531 [Hypothenemus hampei]|uniref:THAP-type domain-containing protein n=1 Tax=Hypothenemus hampei TaxID=57062 RepID=A0ABD1E450_HYPHA